MPEKQCFKCGVVKSLTEFYAHKRMGDGHLNKCKECAKRDVRVNYERKRDYYSKYEQQRFQKKERKEWARTYQKERRLRNPEKDRARQMVNYSLRTGKLLRLPCEVCGTTHRVEAHHDDYSRPLDVRWLCFKHHRELGHGQIVTNNMGTHQTMPITDRTTS